MLMSHSMTIFALSTWSWTWTYAVEVYSRTGPIFTTLTRLRLNPEDSTSIVYSASRGSQNSAKPSRFVCALWRAPPREADATVTRMPGRGSHVESTACTTRDGASGGAGVGEGHGTGLDWRRRATTSDCTAHPPGIYSGARHVRRTPASPAARCERSEHEAPPPSWRGRR